MCYAGSNRPLAPLNDPYQMLDKLYGQTQGRKTYASILDSLGSDLKRVSKNLSVEDRILLEQHMTLVEEMEREISVTTQAGEMAHPEPELDPNIELVNDNTPQLARMQIDLLVNAMANDMSRIGSLQFMRSVGQARMRWLDINEGHHSLSHEPDKNEGAQNKLEKINVWFAEQLAYLAKKSQKHSRSWTAWKHARLHHHRLGERAWKGQLPHPRRSPDRYRWWGSHQKSRFP
jgi:hypothetical protein